MSVNIKRKEKEKTKMEKRETAIMNFIGVALIPLALILFLGFSWGNSNKVNSENLFKEVKDMQKKDENRESEILILTGLFSLSVDTLLRDFEEKYSTSKKKLRDATDEEEIDDWETDQKRKLKRIKAKILDDLASTTINHEKLKSISGMGVEELVTNYTGALSEEIKARAGKKKCELGMDLDVDLKKENEDLQEEIDDKEDDIERLEDKLERCENSGDDKVQSVQSDCSRIEKDLEEKEEEYEEYEEKVQKKGEDIKGKIEDEAAEIEKLLEELKPAKVKNLFKDRNKMERLRSKLQNHLTKIEAQADKLGDF